MWRKGRCLLSERSNWSLFSIDWSLNMPDPLEEALYPLGTYTSLIGRQTSEPRDQLTQEGKADRPSQGHKLWTNPHLWYTNLGNSNKLLLTLEDLLLVSQRVATYNHIFPHERNKQVKSHKNRSRSGLLPQTSSTCWLKDLAAHGPCDASLRPPRVLEVLEQRAAHEGVHHRDLGPLQRRRDAAGAHP